MSAVDLNAQYIAEGFVLAQDDGWQRKYRDEAGNWRRIEMDIGSTTLINLYDAGGAHTHAGAIVFGGIVSVWRHLDLKDETRSFAEIFREVETPHGEKYDKKHLSSLLVDGQYHGLLKVFNEEGAVITREYHWYGERVSKTVYYFRDCKEALRKKCPVLFPDKKPAAD